MEMDSAIDAYDIHVECQPIRIKIREPWSFNDKAHQVDKKRIQGDTEDVNLLWSRSRHARADACRAHVPAGPCVAIIARRAVRDGVAIHALTRQHTCPGFMALRDGVTGDAVTRKITLAGRGQTDTQHATVDRCAGALPIGGVAHIHGAQVSIVADDGGGLAAVRRIAAIAGTEVRVVAIDWGMLNQTGLALRVHGVDGAGVAVVTERFGVREATAGKIAVGQVGRQGLVANGDCVEVARIAGWNMANLHLGARLSRPCSKPAEKG